ncbi:indole-3-glycerol phosphate synthase [Clostridia bacterium]|nr:indole-3-glycerol phosphate synthase [Clostridia bacterium]
MILDTLAESTRLRVEQAKKSAPLEEVKEKALSLPNSNDFPFEKALAAKGLSFICEVKKASPSKGVIATDFPYLTIAKEYEEAGAAAISVLTEPSRFLGSDVYLKDIAKAVKIPVLRKDFTIDSYQIYEAKLLGAAAVLLICALLNTSTLKEYIKIADSLGISALVEAHTEEEVKQAIAAGARIIGVNNRNLQTFEVDITTSTRLRKLVPKGILFVSESGISTVKNVEILRQNGTDAVLIGEMLMCEKDKKSLLTKLRGKPNAEN